MIRSNPFEDPDAEKEPVGGNNKVARADGDVPVSAPDISGGASGGGKLSGDNVADIVTGVVGGLGTIIGSIIGSVGNKNKDNTGSGTQPVYVPVKQNNTWIWVAGAAVVVGLVVFLILKKKK